MMTQDMYRKLRRSIVAHEGYSKTPYVDSVGKITIGIGYNLTDRGMKDDWIDAQYNEDIEFFYTQLNTFPWFKDLNIDRQIVLIDMCFMGWKTFLLFDRMLSALCLGDYVRASQEMLSSKWATQVKDRAIQLADGMRTGVYDV